MLVFGIYYHKLEVMFKKNCFLSLIIVIKNYFLEHSLKSIADSL